jgi:hypothetical protein
MRNKGIIKEYFPEWGKRKTTPEENHIISLFIITIFEDGIKKKRQGLLSFKQIEKLRPTFKYGGISMVDWFTITKGHKYCCINSGLRHADGETKSPFFYEKCVGGNYASQKVLAHFNKWWKTVKHEKNKSI